MQRALGEGLREPAILSGSDTPPPIRAIRARYSTLIWPFTYLGSSVIVDFYDQANWYVGTLAAGSLYGLVFLTFIISALSLKETTRVTKGFIWMEALLYLAIEGLSWYVSIWEYPKAHR